MEQLLRDVPYIEGKYHRKDEPFDPFRRMAYHGWDCDPRTGADDAEMAGALKGYVDSLTDENHAVVKAKAFAFVLDHMRFGFDEHDYFVCLYNWNRPLNAFTINRWADEAYRSVPEENRRFVAEAKRAGEIESWLDYDHSVPDWHALYRYGFPGIRQRARTYREEREKRGPLTADEEAYFDAIDIEYAAILRLLTRLEEYAGRLDSEKAPLIRGSLTRLAHGAPETVLDVLYLIYLYFMLSESVDSYQVRSLGNGLDHDLQPYYERDLASGRFTAEQLDGFIGYFLMQFSAIGNYWGQPLYLGGTNLDGTTRVSEVTYRILDVYDRLGIYNPKLQIKYSRTSPDAYLEKLLDMVRRGHSSMVFVCEDNVVRNMVEIRGIPRERAYDFDIKGCYEFALRGGEMSTAPCYVNLLAPVVRIMNDGHPYESYGEIEARYFEHLSEIFAQCVDYIDRIETQLLDVNPAPMLSATILRSLETARDAYYDGSELNTTVFVVGGLGSAVDSLLAIRYLVFEKQIVSLDGLRQALRDDWADHLLRAKALKCPYKYGNGERESDALAAKIADAAAAVQMTPNSRGGYYKVDIHSARMYINFGLLEPATPDGRKAGEETSKNASPVVGMDKNGVTALIRSALALKPDRFLEGFGLDLMLHETAVQGADGMEALKAVLSAYDEGGGSTCQFNVVSAETLRDAQLHPERYQNLQIRVCGWNALFCNMARSEQDKFILRAENIL